MNIKVDFDNIIVKEDKNDFNVKVLMLKGEKGDQGDGEDNIIEEVQVNGTALPVTNKTVNVPVPIVDSALSSSSTNPVQNKVINTALNGKVDTSALDNYYEISEIDGLLENKADISALSNKADISALNDYYTKSQSYSKSEINGLLDEKVDVTDMQSEISSINSVLNAKANTTDIVNTYETKQEHNTSIAMLSSQISGLASGSPLVASSTSGMTDTTRIYVNTTDGNWYYYNGSSWVSGGVYQASSFPEVTDIRTAYNNIVYQSAGDSVRNQILDTVNAIGNYKYNFVNKGYSGINVDVEQEVSANTKILFNLTNYTGSPTNFIVYAYRNASTPVNIYSNQNVASLVGKTVEITTQEAFVKIRFYLAYTSPSGATADANITAVFGDNNTIYKQLYELNKFTSNSFQVDYTHDVNIDDTNVLSVLGTTNCNDIHDFKTHFFYNCTVMSNAPETNLYGLFYTVPLQTYKSNGQIQFYCKSTGELYFRNSVGTSTNPVWRDWKKITAGDYVSLLNTFNRNTYKIFKKVCCVGDSYTAGYIVDSESVPHNFNEEFAWPHYMATASGNIYYNCGVSGANSNTWLSNVNGLAKAQSYGKVQAYIIGLGLNDASSNPSLGLSLGTTSDIGTENETFYGKYSKIIRELHSISPDAKIFTQNIPNTSSQFADYNTAIAYISNQYANSYNVHLLDLYSKRDYYINTSLTNDLLSGHYTAIGYEQFAEILQYILSDYINNNISYFQDVAFIDYD